MPKKPKRENQLGVTFTPEAWSLLDALLEAKQAEVGMKVSVSGYIRALVEQEAERQGIKPKKGK